MRKNITKIFKEILALKIKNIIIEHGLMLAPMAGVTDRTFRRICREKGAEYTVSEMVSAKALCYEQRSKRKEYSFSATAELATVRKEDKPMAIQIFGREPEFMAEAARMLESGSYRNCRSDAAPDAIDINMGCPVRKITGNGEGSALMKEPALAGRVAEAVCKSVSIPVTAKIRAGWDSRSINAVEVAKILEASGVSAICVHARTREQLYTPGIDMSIIEKVKNAVSIPVIGNGDIYTAEDALRMLRETGCDGIMIGRGAMGNPWLFTEIRNALDGKEFLSPDYRERLSLALWQMKEMIDEHGERTGLAQAKKHLAWYISGMKGCAAARSAIMTAEAPEQIEEIFDGLLKIQE